MSAERRRRAFAAPLVALVRAYQVVLSPLLGGRCRFTPSCSNYAIEALHTHGALRGSWMAARRVLRCHPFGPSGYDPVPPPEPPEPREAPTPSPPAQDLNHTRNR